VSGNQVIRLKHKLQKEHRQGLALDIDETLSRTLSHWVKVLSEQFGNPENLEAHEIILKYRYAQHVPYWQTEEALAWMEEARNSDILQQALPLIENANTFVRKINKIIPILVYATTRPRIVKNGTVNWLKKHNFPIVDLLFRPPEIPIEMGNAWKASVLDALYPEVLGIVDDNPGVVNALPSSYKGTVFLYDLDFHPRTDVRVIPCKTWNDVYKETQRIYDKV
jgi:5'(3')-deoxyribonucleotidase